MAELYRPADRGRTATTLAGRSLERIYAADLSRLADLARRDSSRMFEVNPRWEAYRGRVLGVCLCQGAALHLLDGVNGVKDFDVWTFFARSRSRPFPDPSPPSSPGRG